MMIVTKSLIRQKEGVQGEEEEEAGVQRKGGPSGTPTPGADAPTCPTRSRVSDARNRRKHETMGFYSTGGEEGARNYYYSYPLSIGLKGATERRTKL